MNIDKSVRAVERIFKQLDKETSQFLKSTDLSCVSGCAACCKSKAITANPLEFLPLSYYLYRTNQLEAVYWELDAANTEGCFMVQKSLQGEQCRFYEQRGLVCRLFGSAAMRNKEGERLYTGCKNLKQQLLGKVATTKALTVAPVYADYYMKLRSVDPTYGAFQFPVNLALKKAMEIVDLNTRKKRRKRG